jgi:D-alanine-D-alanine ligase
VARALRDLGHAVSEVDPAGESLGLPAKTEVVFLALHGEYGEDGQVQSRLETLGVPYTGTNAVGSALAFDKARSKEIFQQNQVASPRGVLIDSPTSTPPDTIPAPWILKPATQGSSVGLNRVEDEVGWNVALADSFRHGGAVLCEECIQGRELTVGVLDGVALPVVEVRPKVGGYNYENKYTPGATDYFCPAELPNEITAQVQALGLRAFEAVGARDFGRVDVMLNAESEPYVLEVNTLPGMTETSLLPKAAAVAGMNFNALCQRMLELALRRN